jgi:NADH:ubiquinone oxidoreductase subunit F (NADH-binding)
MEKIVLPDIKDLHLIDVYIANGGYKAIEKALGQSKDDIIDQVKRSGAQRQGRSSILYRTKVELYA